MLGVDVGLGLSVLITSSLGRNPRYIFAFSNPMGRSCNWHVHKPWLNQTKLWHFNAWIQCFFFFFSEEMLLWSHRLWKSTFWQEICHPLELHKIQIAKKKINNVLPLGIRAYHMSRLRQAVLLVDGQVVFLGVRRPTLRFIRLKMSEIILTDRKTLIKGGGGNVKNTLAGIKPGSLGWWPGNLTTTLNDIVKSEDLIIIDIRQRCLLSTNCKICIEDYICRDDFCHLHLSILTNGVFPRRNLLSSNQKMGEWIRCKQTSLMLINVCKTIFIRRSTARSKTTKKSHVNWVCAACLYHLPRLHDHLSRLHHSWNNSSVKL